MMKKEHHTKDTSIFDFDGKDPKPYRGKEIDQAPFKSKRTQPAKQPKLAVVIRKCSSRNRGSQRQMATKDVCQQNATAQEARGNCSSSGSDKIESSDSDLDRDMLRQSHLRIGGAYGTLCGSIEACKEEEFVAEKDREVVIIGKQLWLSKDICIPSPEFTFTADTIVLKIQDAKLECIIKWPLHDIESFRSCADQETGLTLIELDLNESGVHALWEKLEAFLQFDNDYLCHTISSSISNMDVSWSEQVRQITSLSDGYKSVWRPGKEEMIERLKRIHWQRQDLDNLEENRLSIDRMVQERHKDSLDGWFDIVFPKEDHDAVTVTKYDYLLLNPDEFVSDTIIDFYIKYLQSMLPEEKKERLYFFNSFFFRKLTEIDCSLEHGFEKCKSSFERVKRWTARVNIFDKDYLFIPIMQSAHWSLIIICHPGYLSAGCHDGCEWKAPVILHFDSLEGCHAGLEEPIQNYLMEAWSQKNGYHENSGRISALKFVAAKVPQQTNYSDCGIFLLHYVELFINEVMDGHSTDFVTDEWFNPAEASKKREKIQQVIKRLQDEELADRGNSQHYLASNVMVSTDGTLSAQRSPEFGDEDPNYGHCNLSNQIDNTFDSHPLHHESQMQVSAYTCLEQDYSEAGLDFMHSAVPSQLRHSVCFSQLQDPYSVFPMVCHAHQQEAANDSPDYSSVEEGTDDLPKHTMLEENSSDHLAHGREAANLLPDYMISEENSIDYRAHGREAAKNALDYAMAEESSNILKSEAFVNIDPSVDGKVEPGFAFCSSNISQYPYDRGFPDAGNFARQNVVDEMLSSTGAEKFNQSHTVCKQAIDKEMDNSVEQVNETAESFFLVEKVNTQLIKGTVKASVKASAGSSKLKQQVVGSIGAANDQFEDEAIVLMDSEEVETLHNDDDSCRLIDVEFMACEVADDQLKDEAAVVMELRDSESLQDEDDLCKTIIMKGDVPSVRELLECGSPRRNPDNSPPRKGNISGLTDPHCISSDEESDIHYDSKVDKARKTGRQSHRRNAQEGSELVQAHAGRPVTRSASKRTEDKPEGRWLYERRRKKKSIIEVT